MTKLQAACNAYWNARTREEERTAYRRLRELGVPPSYGEPPEPDLDDAWQFGGYE